MKKTINREKLVKHLTFYQKHYEETEKEYADKGEEFHFMVHYSQGRASAFQTILEGIENGEYDI